MTKIILIAAVVILIISVAGLIAAYFQVLTPEDRSSIWQPTFTIEHDGYTRSYRIATPERPDEAKAAPLVIALHGYRDRARQLEFYSGLTNLGHEEDFIAVYPEGLQRSWNGGFCCGFAQQAEIDDIGFIHTLIEELTESHDIDEQRIYIIGFSNGGILAQKLIDQYPDLFAGAAIVMSGAGADASNGEGRVVLQPENAHTPLLFINGENDRYVPLTSRHEARSGFSFISQEETLHIWQRAYGCETEPESQTTPRFQRSTYTCEDNQLESLAYYDTGHQWPDWRITQPHHEIPDSTRHIWEFWSRAAPVVN